MKRVRARWVLGAVVALGAVAAAASLALPSLRSEPSRQRVLAPIVRAELVSRDSAPPQVTLKIQAGLSNGCAKPDEYSVARSGHVIQVTVWNSVPAGDVACTEVYGAYDLAVPLAGDLRPGAVDTVRVNGADVAHDVSVDGARLPSAPGTLS